MSHNEDTLDDPMDDGSMPLAPGAFDPLCELRGETWPKDEAEAAGFKYEQAHWPEGYLPLFEQ